ncbi:MAG TPA: prepilin peptidase [Deltaproteobacteria bacterium]|nr:prepilin peptidase [Deltaproteobacteria bacterium]
MVHITLKIFVFLLGSVIGSFLNVCIFRIPREKSIIHPPSFCPQCEKPIKFYDNIPIVSYVLLKGRCRSCGVKIPFRYPFVEFITALLFLILYMQFGLSFEWFVNIFFLCLLIIISFIDLDFKIIPDILSIGGLGAGLFFSFFRPLFKHLEPVIRIQDAFLGVVIGGGVLFAIAFIYQFFTKKEGMGGGDIKLLAMIGSFCGIRGVIFSLLAGSLFGTIVGIPLMIAKGGDTKYAIPFGPFLSLGALLFILKGDMLIGLFLNFLRV